MPRLELRPRRWGTASALFDDEEARRRLVAAAVRCILRRVTARIRMDEVAAEAGVSRATVYRYFSTREDLILGVLLSRLDAALDTVVRSLERPADAARSIPDLILSSISLVHADEVSEALFSSDGLTPAELTAEPIVEGVYRHLAPLLRQWQSDGQLHHDLDSRMTVRWMNVAAVTLMTPPWREMSPRAKRIFLNQYLVRALLRQGNQKHFLFRTSRGSTARQPSPPSCGGRKAWMSRTGLALGKGAKPGARRGTVQPRDPPPRVTTVYCPAYPLMAAGMYSISVS